MTADPGALTSLLASLTPDARSIQIDRVTTLTGGFSTDTFRAQGVWDRAGHADVLDVVVRRVRPDGLLAPYDVEREHRILVALQGSSVPVPRVYGCDPGGEHLGSPSLVTAYVEGEPLSFFGRAMHHASERLPSYFATLAAIHALDWRALGLQLLDEADDPLEGEICRSADRLHLNDGLGAGEAALIDWLREHKPDDTGKAFLHGDPNPANYICRGTRVVAVLDWELALVGDVRIDLGFFAAIQSTLAETWLLDTDSYLRGYATANPAVTLDHLDYFEALGLLRAASFLRAAELRRGVDVTEPWRRLRRRFGQITSGTG